MWRARAPARSYGTSLVGVRIKGKEKAKMAKDPGSKRFRRCWFDSLVEWIRSSPDCFVVENTLAVDERTIVTIRDVKPGELLCSLPTIGSGSTDAELAWFLASKPSSIGSYLASLPEVLSLPRDMPEYDELLQGSPVLNQIQHVRNTMQAEYKQFCSSNPNALISWKEFQYSYNAVTSRAFDGPVLVPLLDMCNHARGQCNDGVLKNVSYTFQHEPLRATVRAVAHIPAGTPLYITYGAQSNAQLYVNYGFCVTSNTEPDGSSNDILEWADGVVLRTGPRLYTYGPFVKALDSFMQPDEGDNGGSKEGTDAVEAFLDECDAEEDHGYDGFDGCYEVLDINDSVTELVQDQRSADKELEAVRLFYNAAIARAKNYKIGAKDLDVMQQSLDCVKRHISTLVRSEHRILQFYAKALFKLEGFLTETPTLASPNLLALDDCERTELDEQTGDLVKAYMQIRHPDKREASS